MTEQPRLYRDLDWVSLDIPTMLRRAQSRLYQPPVRRAFLPFCEEQAEQARLGRTTATFRFLRQPYQPRVGETFEIHTGGSPCEGSYFCVARRRMNYGVFLRRHWQQTGMRSPEDFGMLLVRIHDTPEPPAPDAPGFAFLFKRIG